MAWLGGIPRSSFLVAIPCPKTQTLGLTRCDCKKQFKVCIAVLAALDITTTATLVSYEITQFYLPHDRGDDLATTSAEAGSKFIDLEGRKTESTLCMPWSGSNLNSVRECVKSVKRALYPLTQGTTTRLRNTVENLVRKCKLMQNFALNFVFVFNCTT